ncbi:hypothetical protein [Desulfolithobacter dissulfuricans]|uniref:hypothetical protein n=1 Tax=Desulfolithobacter dissulfuricans TaxID=2795293 RepID=UPI002279C632|nr:hypothetical protein [Desulfolithobacter dissulfuricans]
MALRADHDIFTKGLDQLEEVIRPGPDIAMQDNLSFPVEDAEIHFVGVEVYSAIKIMLFGLKSHEKASLC